MFEHFNRKLLGYALTRSVGPGDEALLEQMHHSLRRSGYRFGALIDAVVASRQFRTRAVADHVPITAAK